MAKDLLETVEHITQHYCECCMDDIDQAEIEEHTPDTRSGYACPDHWCGELHQTREAAISCCGARWACDGCGEPYEDIEEANGCCVVPHQPCQCDSCKSVATDTAPSTPSILTNLRS